MDVDVAIVGGGPAGSTTGSLLAKYDKGLKVAIFEREVFPRDHVGESQLPPISMILDEMGCWDKVEAANFPIKIGGTYRWGKTPELWDLDFVPAKQFKNEPRPAKFEGQRTACAFQVDRSIYDEILLDHAADLGCGVHEGTKVKEIVREGDKVSGLKLESGEAVTARYYVDASGTSGILRRTMGVAVDYPTALQNIAIWDYWQNADWAVEIGTGGTRIQVLSLPYGWLWFIPLGPTRTSIGLVTPAEYFKGTGKKPDELYLQAVKEEERVAKLTQNAVSENNLMTTRDWSNIAERQFGENWFLVGESGGFADPILSAGLTLAHQGGRELAYTILELDRGKLKADWLKEEFAHRQSSRIRNHIRFADFWYTANAQFLDLKENTAKIARDAGLDLEPDQAWLWIAKGGFIDEDLHIGAGGYSISEIKDLNDVMTELDTGSPLTTNNVFRLDLQGASWKDRAEYMGGKILRSQCYRRGERVLPIQGIFELLVNILQRDPRLPVIVNQLAVAAESRKDDPNVGPNLLLWGTQALEAMVNDGWVKASYDPNLPLIRFQGEDKMVQWNTDNIPEAPPQSAEGG